MIIGEVAAALVNAAAENGMCERISTGFDFPVLIDKIMPVLSRSKIIITPALSYGLR